MLIGADCRCTAMFSGISKQYCTCLDKYNNVSKRLFSAEIKRNINELGLAFPSFPPSHPKWRGAVFLIEKRVPANWHNTLVE